jgi:hypothetical protein
MVCVMAAAVVVLVHRMTFGEFYRQDQLTARQSQPIMVD